jgi:hypothetical protein
MNAKNAENVKEYGLIDISFSDDEVHKNSKDKMKKMILTSNPNDKLYSSDEQTELTPKYYLPFYINIFNKSIKTINDIKKADLKNLFIKDFVDFITNTLKQPLSLKTCISFIKDKSLVEKFISEYKKLYEEINRKELTEDILITNDDNQDIKFLKMITEKIIRQRIHKEQLIEEQYYKKEDENTLDSTLYKSSQEILHKRAIEERGKSKFNKME